MGRGRGEGEIEGKEREARGEVDKEKDSYSLLSNGRVWSACIDFCIDL